MTTLSVKTYCCTQSDYIPAFTMVRNIALYYILIHEILRNIGDIKCVFYFPYFHCTKLLFTAVKHIFRIFTGLLLDYFHLVFRPINII